MLLLLCFVQLSFEIFQNLILPASLIVKAGLVMGPLRPSVRLSTTLLGYLVCVICNSIFFIHNLDYDCSHIENVHLQYCAHLINIFF